MNNRIFLSSAVLLLSLWGVMHFDVVCFPCCWAHQPWANWEVVFSNHHPVPAFTVFLCAVYILLLVQNQTWKLSDANCVNGITLKGGLSGRAHSLPCCYGYLQPVPESERLHHQQRVGKAQLRPELPPESNGTAKSDKRWRKEKKRWEVFLDENCLWSPL